MGANRGQSFQRLRAILPSSEIHCFEPAPDSFAQLQKVVAGDTRAHLNQIGLASKRGTARFTQGLGTANHILAPGTQTAGAETEVSVLTGDAYCRDTRIEHVDFLKVDTEGHDLDVLLGFADMLRARRIAVLQVETTSNLDNRFHVHLERFIHFLHPFNYRLTALIDPVRRVNKTGQPLRGIWYCNAVFACEIEAPKLRRDGVN